MILEDLKKTTVAYLAIIWAVWQLYATTFSSLDAITLRAGHILFLLNLGFLLNPLSNFCVNWKGWAGRRCRICLDWLHLGWLDWLWLLAGNYAFIYLICNYQTITLRGGYFSPSDYWAAGLGVVVCFELARRVVGSLAVLAAIFLAYDFLGFLIPGSFGHTGYSIKRVVEHLFWGTQGILGISVGVSATYIFSFILLGTFLKYSGFSDLINDLALSLVGHKVGGPAKVAVLASALMGMINGSAIANVATTGTLTIPLMKRTGYKPAFAAAVEAVASTGGQFAPPIMGAVGFVMAEFMGVPYTTVMLAAIIPAFLYYLSLVLAVHLEAKRLGLQGLSAEHLPKAWQVLKAKWHLTLPLWLLLYLMFSGYTPLFAGNLCIVVVIISSWMRKSTRLDAKMIQKALTEGAISALPLGVACVAVGLSIGSISLTGLGLTFGYAILNSVALNNLLAGGFLVMLFSLVLGLGIPGVAAYVLVATVGVPILLKLGADPLAAHFFCLFYACLSNITPPVALASYVAAAIAKANATEVSFIAIQLGLVGFVLPFFFLDNPILLFSVQHDSWLMGRAGISACLGVILLTFGLQAQLHWGWRILLGGAGLLSIHPGLVTDLLGLGIAIIFLGYSYVKKNY